MPTKAETAYPRLKNYVTSRELTKIYTPTQQELALANQYTVRQVMARFHCGDRLLRIKRSQPDFTEWSQQRDPEGIAWKYQQGQFVPNMG